MRAKILTKIEEINGLDTLEEIQDALHSYLEKHNGFFRTMMHEDDFYHAFIKFINQKTIFTNENTAIIEDGTFVAKNKSDPNNLSSNPDAWNLQSHDDKINICYAVD